MNPLVVVQSSVSGGAEAYLVRLYSRMRGDGHEARLLGHIPGWAEAELPFENIGFGPKWSKSTIIPGVARLPREVGRLGRHPWTQDADCIHLQFKREQIGFTRLLASRAPVVWTEHGRWLPGVSGRLLGAAYRRAAQRSSAIICVSAGVATDVRQIVGASPRIEVIENSIDTALYSIPSDSARNLVRAQFGISPEEKVLAWVGRLHPDKLPELAVQVGRMFPGTTLIAGGGPRAAAVEAATKDSRVKYLGHLNDPRPVYQAADVFLFTSVGGEGFPTMAMLEAAATGIPIVLNSSAGLGDALLDAGFAVAGDSPKELLAAVSNALVNRTDLSRAARAWAEQHDVIPWTQVHAALLNEVAASS